MPGVRSPLFVLILVTYLTAGVLYAVLTPPWQSPDEPAHYNYVRYLVQRPGFPELVRGCYNQAYLEQLAALRFPPELPVDHMCYEFYQPPLYYLLTTPAYMLGQGSLPVLRLFSVLLGGGVVGLAFLISRTIFPHSPVLAYGTMAFVAFVPMHTAMMASVNNDVLAELIIAVTLFLLVRRLRRRERPSLQSDLLLGLFLGLGLLTKFTVYVLVLPLTALTLWWGRHGQERLAWARSAAVVFGLALFLVLPWYSRNAVLYGGLDILGLARHDQVVVGQPRTADFLAEVGWISYAGALMTTTFHSFWGQFGWMAVPMDGRTYFFLMLLSLVALAGLIGFGWGLFFFQYEALYALSTGQRRALLLMALAVVLMALAYGGYNLRLKQFQGRYLFPALIPVGLFFTLGLREAFGRRWVWRLTAGLALVLAWLLIGALFSGDLDKRAALALGVLVVAAIGRAWLARYRLAPAAWYMAACYAALAGLTLAAPFWFVAPYLTP